MAFQIRVMATAYKMPVIQKPERQTSELVINNDWAWGPLMDPVKGHRTVAVLVAYYIFIKLTQLR